MTTEKKPAEKDMVQEAEGLCAEITPANVSIVERLAEAYHDAMIDESFSGSPSDEQRGPYWNDEKEFAKRCTIAGIRAVIRVLAAMKPWDAMPDEASSWGTFTGAASKAGGVDLDAEGIHVVSAGVKSVRRRLIEGVLAVLSAKDALLRDMTSELERLRAEVARLRSEPWLDVSSVPPGHVIVVRVPEEYTAEQRGQMARAARAIGSGHVYLVVQHNFVVDKLALEPEVARELGHLRAELAATREAMQPWATREYLEGLRDRSDEPLKGALTRLLEDASRVIP